MNLEEGSRAYGTEQPSHMGSQTQIRSNSADIHTESRKQILPIVKNAAIEAEISTLIKKNISDREALKRDMASLKHKKPDWEPTLLGEGEQRRQQLIASLEKAMRESKNKGTDAVSREELYLGQQAL